jgi:hypothetical protein
MTGRREQRADGAIKVMWITHLAARFIDVPRSSALNEPIRIILDLPTSHTSGRADERMPPPPAC